MELLDINNVQQSIESFNQLTYEEKLRVVFQSMDAAQSDPAGWLNTFREVLLTFSFELRTFLKYNKGQSIDELVECIIKDPDVIQHNRNKKLDNLID